MTSARPRLRIECHGPIVTLCYSYESSHRIPTIISDHRCRNQLSSTCSFRPKHRDNCLVRIPLEDSRLLSVLLTNVCHLQNKLDDLSVLSEQYYPEIMCITESWLSCNIPNIAVNLDTDVI